MELETFTFFFKLIMLSKYIEWWLQEEVNKDLTPTSNSTYIITVYICFHQI